MFDTLKIDEEFGHFKLENSKKVKIEGIRSTGMKLHDDVIQTFLNVRIVHSTIVNIISMGK